MRNATTNKPDQGSTPGAHAVQTWLPAGPCGTCPLFDWIDDETPACSHLRLPDAPRRMDVGMPPHWCPRTAE